MSRLLLLSGIFILAFSRIGVATRRIACNVQSHFTADLTNEKRASFRGSKLTIEFNEEDLVMNSDRGTLLNLRSKENVVVHFEGYVEISNKGMAVSTEPEKITQTYIDHLSGMAQLLPYNYTGYVINHCRLVLLPIELDRFKVHHGIANVIHRLAESCLELEICSRIEYIRDKNEYKASNVTSTEKAPVEVATEAWTYFDSHDCDDKLYSDTVQLAINKVVDVGLSEVIKKMVKTDDGSIAIPNVNKTFAVTLGFVETTAYFEAVDGTFRDLTTIRRTKNTTLSHDRMKFMASCEFGLTLADLKFDHYKLKYLAVKLNGKLSGSINGAALKAQIAVDFNRKPCSVSVEYINVTEFGTMTVDLTGLGPLNDATSKLINLITKTWRDNIIHTIETKMRASVESQLSSLNCEKFRP